MPKERKVTLGPRLLATVSKGLSTEGDRLGTSEVPCAATSKWYGTDGHDDESHFEETDWTEDFYETDDYDPNGSTFSDHCPALLEQTVETQEGDTSKLETVQEAVAAASAAADMSRRTWTQARHLMKDVHRSRGYFPVSNRKHDGSKIKGKTSHAARKDAPAKEKENARARAKEKAEGDVLDRVSCARDLTGLVTILHTMEERASVSTHSARDTRILHRFDKLTWKATSMTGSQVQVLLQSRFHFLQNFASFDLDGKFILDSGATMSMGGVDLLQRIQEMYAQARLRLSSHPVSPLRFSFANGQEDVSTSVLPVPYVLWKVFFLHSSVERARTSAVGSRCARRFGTCC